MNYTLINTTSVSCGSVPLLRLQIPRRLSLELRAVLIFRIVVNAIICPIVVLMNILVMVAVKTKRQLRTKSNVSLACLATTDLVVGLVALPLQIIRCSFMLKGETGIICSWVEKITQTLISWCIIASLNHLVVLSAERYLAIKHSFAYESLVTEVRIMVASSLAWAIAIILPMEDFWPANIRIVTTFAAVFMSFISFVLVFYFNISVYREVRRNEKQIIANQVSLEEKKKLLKKKKAFYCTVIVLLTIFLCYFPASISVIVMTFFIGDSIAINVKHIMAYFLFLLPLLNSLFNPLIYAVRIRDFRVAFIQLLARKTIPQAVQVERNIFGPKQGRAVAAAEQGERRVSRGDQVTRNRDIELIMATCGDTVAR